MGWQDGSTVRCFPPSLPTGGRSQHLCMEGKPRESRWCVTQVHTWCSEDTVRNWISLRLTSLHSRPLTLCAIPWPVWFFETKLYSMSQQISFILTDAWASLQVLGLQVLTACLAKSWFLKGAFSSQEFCSWDCWTRTSLCWFWDWKTSSHERTC